MPAAAFGDVWPVAPNGFTSSLLSFNTAGKSDLINTGAGGLNEYDITGASTVSPQGVSGGSAWNYYDIWRGWDFSRDVLVGRTGYGKLALTNGERFAPQSVTIGEQAGSVGYMALAGANTSLSNTRENIPGAVKIANEAGSETVGSDFDAFITRAQANTYEDIGSRTSGSSFTRSQRPKGSYNITVGKAGHGALDLFAETVAEIEHQLLIGGEYVSTTWTNRVGGRVQIQGSTLIVYGKAYANPSASATDAPASINGTNGVIELSGATVRFVRGLTNQGTIIVKASSTPTIFIGDLTNEGTLCVESGATLIYSGTFSNPGELLRGNCPNVIVGIDEVAGLYPDGAVGPAT